MRADAHSRSRQSEAWSALEEGCQHSALTLSRTRAYSFVSRKLSTSVSEAAFGPAWSESSRSEAPATVRTASSRSSARRNMAATARCTVCSGNRTARMRRDQALVVAIRIQEPTSPRESEVKSEKPSNSAS